MNFQRTNIFLNEEIVEISIRLCLILIELKYWFYLIYGLIFLKKCFLTY